MAKKSKKPNQSLKIPKIILVTGKFFSVSRELSIFLADLSGSFPIHVSESYILLGW